MSKNKKKVKEYRIGTFISIITGSLLLTSFFLFFLLFFPLSSFFMALISLFLITWSGMLIIVGLWTGSKARDFERSLGAYDKEREGRKAQQPIHPAATEPTAQLQYCPSCGKKLQPGWEVCAYCGKRLKKSD